MAYKEVEHYHLTYQGRPIVWLRLKNENFLHQLEPPASDAIFVTDLLRNEKPVFFDPQSKVISSAAEEVGEEES